MSIRDTQFKPGEGGRPKGCKNHFTQLKQDILTVYQELGGKDWLKSIAENPRTVRDFLRLLGERLPKEIAIDIESATPFVLKLVKDGDGTGESDTGTDDNPEPKTV